MCTLLCKAKPQNAVEYCAVWPWSTAQGVPVDDDSIMLIRSGQCRLVRTVQRTPLHGLIDCNTTHESPQTTATEDCSPTGPNAAPRQRSAAQPFRRDCSCGRSRRQSRSIRSSLLARAAALEHPRPCVPSRALACRRAIATGLQRPQANSAESVFRASCAS